MEQITDLKAKTEKFASYCDQAKKAQTVAEVDDAKVQGLIAYNELLRQVNRVRNTLVDITRDQRALLTQHSYQSARAAVQKRLQDTEMPSANKLSVPVAEAKPEKKSAKKTTKKAKK